MRNLATPDVPNGSAEIVASVTLSTSKPTKPCDLVEVVVFASRTALFPGPSTAGVVIVKSPLTVESWYAVKFSPPFVMVTLSIVPAAPTIIFASNPVPVPTPVPVNGTFL